MPAARTVSSAARSASGDGARPTMSSGVQRAPRANTGDVVDVDEQAVALDVVVRPRARCERPEADPARVDRRGPPSAPTTSRTSYRAGAPWVCGHQRSTAGIRSSPWRASSLPSGRLREPRRDDRPVGPSTSSSTRIARSRRPSEAPEARRGPDSTPSSPSSRGRRRQLRRRRGRRRRSSQIGRHGPTAAGPGENAGIRPSSIVRNQRRLLSATSRVRQRARGRRWPAELRRQRPAADRELVVRPRSAAPTSIAWRREHRLALAAPGSPFRKTSASVARPSRRSTTSSPAAAGAASNVVRNHQSWASRSPAVEPGVAQRAGRGPGHQRREPVPGRRGRPASGVRPATAAAACQPSTIGTGRRARRPGLGRTAPGGHAVSATASSSDSDRLGPGRAQGGHRLRRIERPAAGELEAEDLAAVDDPAHRRGRRERRRRRAASRRGTRAARSRRRPSGTSRR